MDEQQKRRRKNISGAFPRVQYWPTSSAPEQVMIYKYINRKPDAYVHPAAGRGRISPFHQR